MEKAVVTIGASGIIRSANQCAVIMFGYTRPNELIGQNVSVLCPHPYKEQHDSYLQHYHETGVPKVCQLSLSTPPSTITAVVTSSSTLESEPLLFQVIGADRTTEPVTATGSAVHVHERGSN
jgi:PAS domain S-box-containing protein